MDAAVEEQRGLVERCVAAESEVDRLQSQLTQLRRKLDDSTAALHELGRENQNLQVRVSLLLLVLDCLIVNMFVDRYIEVLLVVLPAPPPSSETPQRRN